jgi:hypothetical protein
VAYACNESGRLEVYVRPFPDAQTNKWTVSSAGGSQPRWRRMARSCFTLRWTGADVRERDTRPAVSLRFPTPLFAASLRVLSGGAPDTTYPRTVSDSSSTRAKRMPIRRGAPNPFRSCSIGPPL